MNKPVRIGNCAGGGLYAQLLSRARELQALDVRLRQLLPPPLNEHCCVLNIRDATLVLAADSPVWASRLRYCSSQLVKQLAAEQTVTVRTVRVRVQPPAKPFTPQRRQPSPRLSSRGAAIIRQAAGSVSDARLKSALLRLAGSDTAI